MAVQIPQSARLAYVNNNPGNLRYVGQKGASEGEGGFARFSSPEAGYEALKAQIALDTSRGHTLSSFLNKYAPSIENNTSLYVKQIAQWTGYDPNTKLSEIDLDTLAAAMAKKESSTNITNATMIRGKKAGTASGIRFDEFDKSIEEARKRGYSDSMILNALSAKDSDFGKKVEIARGMYGQDKNITNDRDLINWLSYKYTGNDKLSVPSVPDKKQIVNDGDKQYFTGRQEQYNENIKNDQEAINWFEKYFVNPTGEVADFLFENFGKAAGSTLVDSYYLATGQKDKATAMQQASSQPGVLFFAALEVMPGGGKIVETLSKIPGLGKIIETIGKAGGKISKYLKNSAVEMMTKALRPTTKEMKEKTAKIVEEALEKGIKGSANAIEEKSSKFVEMTGEALETALKQIPDDLQVEIKPIIQKLVDKQKEFIVNGVVVNKQGYEMINRVGDLILEFGGQIDYKSLRKVRQIIDEMTYGAGKVFGKTVSESREIGAQTLLVDAIRDELSKASPEIAKINSEYSFWKTLNEIINTTIERTKPQTGLIEKGAQIAGQAVGYSQGGFVKGIITGEVFKQMARFMKSTTWQSVSAVNRNRLANLIADGKVEEAAYIMGRLYDGMNNSKEN